MASNAPRILQIAHSVPNFQSGGTEATAFALHRQALTDGFDSWYLGALDDNQIVPNLGTPVIAFSPDHRESALFTSSFSRFRLEQPEHHGFLRDFSDYLLTIRPDIIHFHHVLQFGLEAVHTARAALPEARIILTAHDYYLICANNGQLYKYVTKQRCDGPQLRECMKCIPTATANDFALRRLDIAATLRLVDRIAAPSHFLKCKLEANLDLDQPVQFIENAFLGEEVIAPARHAQDDAIVFGYFGNISAIKGLADLLDAADLLRARGRDGFRIHVHGAQLFEDKVLKDRMDAARTSLGTAIRFFGGYQERELASHIAEVDCVIFPSVWWENAPLVIYEALHHGRQVISYPHGGAPEILRRYGTGLLAARSTPESLAVEMERVLDNPDLVGCAPVRSLPTRRDLLASYSPLYFD